MSTQCRTCDGTNDVWQVVSGSGMGLIQSAAVSNAAFYDMVEKRVELEETRTKYSIHLYIRYMDDIWLVLSGTFEARLEFMYEYLPGFRGYLPVRG